MARTRLPTCGEGYVESPERKGGKTGKEHATYLRDVLDDNNLEFVSIGLEDLTKVSGLALRAHGAAHGEPCLEEGFDDPYSDVAVRACDEDLS